MSVNDELGIRMKDYETRNQYYLQKRTPVAIRVDGRSFHTFTKGFKRPFDTVFMTAMQQTAKYMCENMGNAKFAYVQSDEITIILVDYDTLKTDCWFNYRTDKLCSIAASMVTMAFNKEFKANLDNFYYADIDMNDKDFNLYQHYMKSYQKGAMFDARCFNIPKEEVCNLIYWRQLDATRNSIQMVGQAHFSHRELESKSCNDIQNMLLTQKNINWNNDFTIPERRGTACYKDDALGGWLIDYNMPILRGADRNYVEKHIFVGEE